MHRKVYFEKEVLCDFKCEVCSVKDFIFREKCYIGKEENK